MSFQVAELQFSTDLLRELSHNATVSALVSPLSIILTLSMAYLGAERQTREEFRALFGGTGPDTQLYETLRSFIFPKSFTPELELWMKPYIQHEFILKSAYTNCLQRQYGIKPEYLRFEHPTASAKRINSDVSNATHHLIKEAVSPADFSPLTRLVLVGTIYLKVEWGVKFERHGGEVPFYSDKNTKRSIPMMKSLMSAHSYRQTADLRMLNIALVRSVRFNTVNFYLSILLPQKQFGLWEALNNLNAEKLNWLFSKSSTKGAIFVYLPAFKFEEKSLDLTAFLHNRGLYRGFNSSMANFHGISDQNNVYINNFIQKSKIDVSTEGITASAVSIARNHAISAPLNDMGEDLVFQVDQPFLYFLRSRNNDILFAGIETFNELNN